MPKILKIIILSRLLFFLFALGGTTLFSLQESYLGKQFDLSVPYFFSVWANFDGRHFLNIASDGYANFDFAFFPLYPLFINVMSFVLPISKIYLGILISLTTLLLAVIVIYKIIKLDFKEKLAYPAITFLLFFPLAFFYQAVYPDSLFILLSTTSFYFARKKNWFLSGIFGGLTVLTRLSGIALLPALVLEWYVQNRKRVLIDIRILGLLFVPLGLILYMLYLQIFHGDFLLFQKAMIAWRQNEFVFPPQIIFRYLKIFLTVDMGLLVYWVAVLEFLTFFLYMGLAIYVWKKIRSSYGLFMVVLLLLVTFTGTFAGTPRYLLHLFPAFLAIALLVKKRPILRFLLIMTFLVLGFILTGLFTRGYFVS